MAVDKHDQISEALAAELRRHDRTVQEILGFVPSEQKEKTALVHAACDLISFGPPVTRLANGKYICLQCGCGLANWKPLNEGVHAPGCAWDALRTALKGAEW